MIGVSSFVVAGSYSHVSYRERVGVQIRPLLPVLNSNWLSVYVMACFVGYEALALGTMCLLKANVSKKI